MISTIPETNFLDLIGQDTEMRRVASTNGGEFAGPCPFCGGRDRFHAWPDHPSGKARFWCRQCEAAGDVVDYMRQKHGLSYREACEQLHIPPATAGRKLRPTPPSTRKAQLLAPPPAQWQEQALSFVEESRVILWSAAGSRALAWLRDHRDLQDETIQAAGLGLNPEDRFQERQPWGLPENGKRVWLPRGVVIPWLINGDLWRVNVRRPAGEPKYIGPAGWQNALYNADALTGERRPAALVEGEFDALTVQQEAGDLVNVVATGSTDGARRPRWIALLAQARSVLVSFDADEPGEKGAAYWLDTLPNARRWRPYFEDVNGMAQAGVSVRSWVEHLVNVPAERFTGACQV